MTKYTDKAISKIVTLFNVSVILNFILLGLVVFLLLDYKKIEEPEKAVAWCGTADIDGTNRINTRIFKQNCAVCHVYGSQTITGPGMSGILDRIPNEIWFNQFVQNEDSLIKIKDPYTMMINEKFEDVNFNHNFSFLTTEELNEIKTGFGPIP